MKKISHLQRAGCIAILAGCLLPQAGRGADIVWNGSTDTNWLNGANWNGGVAPANDTNTDVAVFTGALTTFQPVLTQQVASAGIRLESTGWVVGKLAVKNQLGAAGMVSFADTTNSVNQVLLAANQEWLLGSNSVLTVSALSGSAYTVYLGNETNNGRLILSGVNAGGDENIEVRNGILELARRNSYSVRNLTITNGEVIITATNGNQIIDNRELKLTGANAVFNLNNRSESIQTLTFHAGTIKGGGILTNNGTGSGTFRGDVTLGAPGDPLLKLVSGARFSIWGSTRTFTVLSDVEITDELWDSVASTNNAGLIKAGAGTLTLSGASAFSYPGDSVVNEGKLAIAGFGGGGPILVNAGGVLGGTGTLFGPVTNNVGGMISPGMSMGTLTCYGALQNDGALLMEITKDGGLTNDVLAAYGSWTGGGSLVVSNVGSTPLVANDTFVLFQGFTPPMPTFSSISLPSGYVWDTSSLYSSGSITVTGLMPTPTATNITFATVGDQVVMDWPSGQGWRLECQTNSLNPDGWTTVAPTPTPPYTNTVDLAIPATFFRLVFP